MELFISLFAIKTLLCTCIFRADETSIKEIISKADLIIYAKAVPDHDAKIYNDSTVFVEQINFEINSVLKGRASTSVHLMNSMHGCGAQLRVRENYIIFAFKNLQSGKFETGGCQSISEWTKKNLKDPTDSMDKERQFFRNLKDLIRKEVKE